MTTIFSPAVGGSDYISKCSYTHARALSVEAHRRGLFGTDQPRKRIMANLLNKIERALSSGDNKRSASRMQLENAPKRCTVDFSDLYNQVAITVIFFLAFSLLDTSSAHRFQKLVDEKNRSRPTENRDPVVHC